MKICEHSEFNWHLKFLLVKQKQTNPYDYKECGEVFKDNNLISRVCTVNVKCLRARMLGIGRVYLCFRIPLLSEINW